MIERVKCALGLHVLEIHTREWGNRIRMWQFCKRPNCRYLKVLYFDVPQDCSCR